MSLAAENIIANDNDPPAHCPLGDATGFRQLVRDKQTEYMITKHSGPVLMLTQVHTKTRWLNLGLFFWIGALLGLLAAQLADATAILKFGAAQWLLWASLWVSYAGTRLDTSRLAEIANLTALAAFFFSLGIGVFELGYPLLPESVLFIGIVACVLMSLLLRSNVANILSNALCVLWIILTQESYLSPSPLLAVLPLAAAAQLFSGWRLRSSVSIWGLIISFYVVIGLTYGWQFPVSNLPILCAMTSWLTLSVCHHITASLADAHQINFAQSHKRLSAMFIILAGLGLQYYLLFFVSSQTVSLFELDSGFRLFWLGSQVTLGFLLVLLLVLSVHMRKISKLKMVSLAVLTLAATALVLLETEIMTVLEPLFLLSSYTALGLLIGGSLMALGFFVAISAWLERKLVSTFAGLMLIAVQSDWFFNGQAVNSEHVLLFASGVLLAACIIVTITSPRINAQSNGHRSGAAGWQYA